MSAAKPVKVILFGSRARETAHPGSDVDLLVVERDPVVQHQEAVRLRRLLRDFQVPIDTRSVSSGNRSPSDTGIFRDRWFTRLSERGGSFMADSHEVRQRELARLLLQKAPGGWLIWRRHSE